MLSKKILLNFNYSRDQWVKLCKPFFADNKIHWLSFIDKAHDHYQHIGGHNYHYWSDFENSKEVIEEIKPDVIVIMDNLAPLTFALLYQAKKRSIPTYYLQHGVFSSYFDYLVLDKANRSNKVIGKPVDKFGFSTFQFLKSSIKNLFIKPKLMSYLLLSKFMGQRRAAYAIRFNSRIPDYYLCYDYENATIHKEIDGITNEKIIIVGNPELELFINNYEKVSAFSMYDKYWLLIDQALSGSDIGEAFISRKKHCKIYKDLADQAQKAGFLLIIKLHPGDYGRKDFFAHKNIVYLKEYDDIISLVKGAHHCFGFWSALLISVAHFKPLTLIKINDISFYFRMQNKHPNINIIDSEYFDVKAEQVASVNVFSTYQFNYNKRLRAVIKNL